MQKIIIVGTLLSLFVIGYAAFFSFDVCNETKQDDKSTIKDSNRDYCVPVVDEETGPNSAFWLAILMDGFLLAAIIFLGSVIIKTKTYFWIRMLLEKITEYKIDYKSRKSKLKTVAGLLWWYFVFSSIITVPITTVVVTYSHEEVLELLPEILIPSGIDTENWCGEKEKSSSCIFEHLGLTSFVILGVGAVFTFVLRRHYDVNPIKLETTKKIEKFLYVVFLFFLGSLIILFSEDKIILYDEVWSFSYLFFPYLVIFSGFTSTVVFLMELLDRYLFK